VPWCGTCSSRRSPLGQATRDRRVSNPLPVSSLLVTAAVCPGVPGSVTPDRKLPGPPTSKPDSRPCPQRHATPQPARDQPGNGYSRDRPTTTAGVIFDGGCAGTRPPTPIPTVGACVLHLNAGAVTTRWRFGVVGPSRYHGEDGEVFEGDLFGPFVSAVGGGVSDASEGALREQVQPLLTGLPVAAGLVTRQVQPHLIGLGVAGREHLRDEFAVGEGGAGLPGDVRGQRHGCLLHRYPVLAGVPKGGSCGPYVRVEAVSEK
jgi:hypothetical protein